MSGHPGWDGIALRERFAAPFRRPFVPADPVADAIDSGLSRRGFLVGAGVVAALSSIAGPAAAGAFAVRRGAGSVTFLLDGIARFTLRAADFGRTDPLTPVRVGLRRTAERVDVTLTGARFPGTDLPADLTLTARRRGPGWGVRLAMPRQGWKATGDLLAWLADTPLEGATTAACSVTWSQHEYRLRLSSAALLEIDRELTLTIGGGRAEVLGSTLSARRVELSLIRDGASVLARRHGARFTRAILDVGGRLWGRTIAPPTRPGSRLDLRQASITSVTFEGHETAEGQRAAVVFDARGGGFSPSEGLQHAENGRARLPLGCLQYAVSGPDDRPYQHLIADLAPAGITARAAGASLRLGSGLGLGGLQLEARGAETTMQRCFSEIEGVELPLGDEVVHTASIPHAARISLGFDGPTSSQPKDWATLRLNLEGDVDKNGDHLIAFCHLQTSILRPRDMMCLRFDLIDMHLRLHDGQPHLFKPPGQPAWMRVVFPPQHVAEEDIFFQPVPDPTHPTAPPHPDAHCPAPTPIVPTAIPRPLRSGLARPSRIVFAVPERHEHDGIPCTVEGLLDWRELQMSVSDRARPDSAAKAPLLPGSWRTDLPDPRGQRPDEAKATETSIEAPYGIAISPNPWSVWRHATQPVVATISPRQATKELPAATPPTTQYVELWNTRLGPFQADSLDSRSGVVASARDIVDPKDPRHRADLRTVRAINTRLPDVPGAMMRQDGGWRRSALLPSPQDAYEIVHLSSDYGLKMTDCHGMPVDYDPPAIPYTRFMLTSLGATATLHGRFKPLPVWDPTKPGGAPDPDQHFDCPQTGRFTVDEWVQDMAIGRDQFVLVSIAGFTLWTGHYVSLIVTREREFLTDAKGGEVAAARRRFYCEVREPVLEYERPPEGVRRTGRRIPFAKVEISPKRTPYLKPPFDLLTGKVWYDDQSLEPCEPRPSAFWMIPETNADCDPFQFTIKTTDWQGRTQQFRMPLLWILGPLASRLASTGPDEGANCKRELLDIAKAYYGAPPRNAPALTPNPNSPRLPSRTEYQVWRTAKLAGQKVSIVPDPVDNSHDRSVEVEEIVFTVDVLSEKAVGWPDRCEWDRLFYPAVESFSARLGAASRLGGRSDIKTVVYNSVYAAYGFSPTVLIDKSGPKPLPGELATEGAVANPGGVFLDILDANLTFPGAKSGGVAKPDMKLKHVGLAGPIGGQPPHEPEVDVYVPLASMTPPPAAPVAVPAVPVVPLAAVTLPFSQSSAIKGIAKGSELFDLNTKLFGAVRFGDIFRNINGFSDVADAIPRLIEEYRQDVAPAFRTIEQVQAKYAEMLGYVTSIQDDLKTIEKAAYDGVQGVIQQAMAQALGALDQAGSDFIVTTLDPSITRLEDSIDSAMAKLDAAYDAADVDGYAGRLAASSKLVDQLRGTFDTKALAQTLKTPIAGAKGALAQLQPQNFPLKDLRSIPDKLATALKHFSTSFQDPLTVPAALQDLQRALEEIRVTLAAPDPLAADRVAAAQFGDKVGGFYDVLVDAIGGYLDGVRAKRHAIEAIWFPNGHGSPPGPPAGRQADVTFANSKNAVFIDFSVAVDDHITKLEPYLIAGTGTLSTVTGKAKAYVQQLAQLLDKVLDDLDAGAGAVAAAAAAVRSVLDPVLGEIDALIAAIPRSVDLSYGWEPPLQDGGPFLAHRGSAAARLRLDVRVTQDLLSGAGANFELHGSLTDCALQILGDEPFLIIEIRSVTFSSKNGSAPALDLKLGDITFAGQLSFVAELAKMLNPKSGPYMVISGDSATAGFRLPIPNITSGAFSLIHLSINPEVRLPFDGSAMRARLSVSTRELPAIFGMGVYGGTLFVALESAPDEAVSIEGAIDGGAVTALSFLGANGVATATFGVYFKLSAQFALLTGYFRAYGTFDVYGLITLNLEFYLGFTYTSDGNAAGDCSITVEIGCGIFSIKVTAHAHKQMSGNSSSQKKKNNLAFDTSPLLAQCAQPDGGWEPAILLPLSAIAAEWGLYRAQFLSWDELRSMYA